MTPRPQVQRSTSYLLVCEQCGTCEPPPIVPPIENAKPAAEPLRCDRCDTLLTLFECFIAPDSVMWQQAPGSMWHHVAYIDQLPRTSGRQIWTTS